MWSSAVAVLIELESLSDSGSWIIIIIIILLLVLSSLLTYRLGLHICGHSQLFIWVLGIKFKWSLRPPQALLLDQGVFLITEPSSL